MADDGGRWRFDWRLMVVEATGGFGVDGPPGEAMGLVFSRRSDGGSMEVVGVLVEISADWCFSAGVGIGTVGVGAYGATVHVWCVANGGFGCRRWSSVLVGSSMVIWWCAGGPAWAGGVGLVSPRLWQRRLCFFYTWNASVFWIQSFLALYLWSLPISLFRTLFSPFSLFVICFFDRNFFFFSLYVLLPYGCYGVIVKVLRKCCGGLEHSSPSFSKTTSFS